MARNGRINAALIEEGMGKIIRGLGIDPRDPNFLDTPERYARFLTEMFDRKELEPATFPEQYNDFILLKHHTLYSLCPHHMIPVEFRASLAYIPNGHVLGLSKLIRILDETNKEPLLQEKFTKTVVDLMYEFCPNVQGAACFVDGQHGCTKIRGVKSDARFVSYKMRGDFETKPELERRFFDLIRS